MSCGMMDIMCLRCSAENCIIPQKGISRQRRADDVLIRGVLFEVGNRCVGIQGLTRRECDAGSLGRRFIARSYITNASSTFRCVELIDEIVGAWRGRLWHRIEVQT